MPVKKMQVSIQNPCNQDWNSFTPHLEGGFCTQCSKTVVDFTQLTDEAIISYFEKVKTPVCGRFLNSQLERDICAYQPPVPKFGLNRWMAGIFIVAGTCASFQANAQNPPGVESELLVPCQYERAPVIMPLKIDTNIIASFQINGKVVGDDNEPLAFACIKIKGTTKSFQTNTKGKFQLNGVTDKDILLVQSVDMITKEFPVKEITHRNKVVLKLEKYDKIIMGFIGRIERNKDDF